MILVNRREFIGPTLRVRTGVCCTTLALVDERGHNRTKHNGQYEKMLPLKHFT